MLYRNDDSREKAEASLQRCWTHKSGVFQNVIEMRPPLVFTKEHASGFLAALEETIGEMHG